MVRKTRMKRLAGAHPASALAILLLLISVPIFIFKLSAGMGGSLHDVAITERGFVPDRVEIRQGDAVHFINNSAKPSWPASDPHPTHEFLNGFDPLHELGPNESWEFTFSNAGEWEYHDHLLPHRRGLISVRSRSFADKLRSLFPPDFLKSTASLEQSNASPPEIAQLIAEKNKVVQAKIVRGMAEKYGPAKALEYMAKSGLPFTGETHLLVHEIGNVAYERYGENALRYCNESFLSACYHGVILNALGDHGMAGVAKTIERCKSAGIHVFTQCAHAAGHGFLASQDYRVLSALPLCDQLGEIDSGIPLFNCYDGVFMENIFGVHEGKPSPNRMVKADDPYYPCNAVPEKYRGGCWSNQATLMVELFHGDLRRVAQHCDAVKDPKYKGICYDNFARQIHPLTEGKTDRAVELCDNATETWKTTCLITLINAAFSVGDRMNMPYEICAHLSEQKSSQADSCYQNLFGVIGSHATDDQGRGDLCSFVRESGRRTECLKRFHLPGDGKLASFSSWRASGTVNIASSADVGAFKEMIAQKGVRVAYAYLKEQWKTNPVAAHDLAHLAGRFAADELGAQGFSLCDENFSFGCYHGLLEELIRQKGSAAVEAARSGCNALSPQGRIASCIHGIGHGVLAWKGSKILPALDVCTSLPEQEKGYCADGVFMEHYTGVMQRGSNTPKDSAPDTWDLCLTMPQQFQPQCVRNQTFSLLYYSGDAFASALHACGKLSGELKEACVRSAGLFATQRARGSVDAARSVCGVFTDTDDHALCISSAAQEFIFERFPESSAQDLCNVLTASAKRQCEQGIAEMRVLY